MYILRLGSVPPDNKVTQVKKFREATGWMLRSSKEIIDQIELHGKCEISSSYFNNKVINDLKVEGFQIGTTMPEHLFYIEE